MRNVQELYWKPTWLIIKTLTRPYLCRSSQESSTCSRTWLIMNDCTLATRHCVQLFWEHLFVKAICLFRENYFCGENCKSSIFQQSHFCLKLCHEQLYRWKATNLPYISARILMRSRRNILYKTALYIKVICFATKCHLKLQLFRCKISLKIGLYICIVCKRILAYKCSLLRSNIAFQQGALLLLC